MTIAIPDDAERVYMDGKFVGWQWMKEGNGYLQFIEGYCINNITPELTTSPEKK